MQTRWIGTPPQKDRKPHVTPVTVPLPYTSANQQANQYPSFGRNPAILKCKSKPLARGMKKRYDT
jgi:hypothetical protein